tara:strand:- start:6290 stop:7285 length:996 start_codon:yes stop_codon:yes gene_type:complete
MAPGGGAVGTGALDGLGVDDRVELLVSLFPHEAPPKINKDDNQSDVTRAVWTLLDDIDKNPQMLSTSQMLALSKADWFKDYFTNAMLRKVCKVRDMSFANMYTMSEQVCPDEPPSSDTQHAFAKGKDGRRVFFEPAKALESIAKCWDKEDGPSVEDKKLLSTLPWGSTWIASACPGKSAKQSKARLVTKEAKLMMMRIFYPSNAPTWRDEHPVRVGEDSVWTFKPIQWVDDVSNMWTGGERRVRLSEEEMLLLEQLPWFLPLIEQKRAKRKCRDNKPLVEFDEPKYAKKEHYDELVPVMMEDSDEEDYNGGSLDNSFGWSGAEHESQSQEV